VKIEAGLIIPSVSKHPLIFNEIEIDDEEYKKAKDKAELIQNTFMASIAGSLVIEYDKIEEE